jgi:hypothetical protein
MIKNIFIKIGLSAVPVSVVEKVFLHYLKVAFKLVDRKFYIHPALRINFTEKFYFTFRPVILDKK